MPASGTKRGLETVTNDVSSPATTRKKVKSAVTQTAVLNFFKPASEKQPEHTTWRVVDGGLLVGRYRKTGEKEEKRGERTKVAGFDLDGTLIVTRSGNRHAKNETDWKWWDNVVPVKLRKLYAEGYQIIIFTNQAGLKAPRKETANLKKFKLKVAAVLDALDIPLTVYAATENDKFRKPRIGMWEEMKADYDLDAQDGVDLKQSYLVGDAAGREGDFSDSDRTWTINVGISFYTPEVFFLNRPENTTMAHRFDPSLYVDKEEGGATEQSESANCWWPTTALIDDPLGVNWEVAAVFKASGVTEIVLFCGSPGAGKSTFYRRHIKPLGYERVNQDTLKSRDKCIRVARKYLGQGKSVAVDNTNADVATRAVWIALAKEHGVPIRCVYFTTPPQLCQHNDAVRAFGGDLVNPEKRSVLPNVAFTGYASRFQEPERSEGFDGDVMRVGFQWQGGDEERKIWTRFWT